MPIIAIVIQAHNDSSRNRSDVRVAGQVLGTQERPGSRDAGQVGGYGGGEARRPARTPGQHREQQGKRRQEQ